MLFEGTWLKLASELNLNIVKLILNHLKDEAYYNTNDYNRIIMQALKRENRYYYTGDLIIKHNDITGITNETKKKILEYIINSK